MCQSSSLQDCHVQFDSYNEPFLDTTGLFARAADAFTGTTLMDQNIPGGLQVTIPAALRTSPFIDLKSNSQLGPVLEGQVSKQITVCQVFIGFGQKSGLIRYRIGRRFPGIGQLMVSS